MVVRLADELCTAKLALRECNGFLFVFPESLVDAFSFLNFGGFPEA
jgi:hypothetical protein